MNYINKHIVLALLSILSFSVGNSQSNWNVSIGGQFQLATLKADSNFFNEASDSGAGINLGASYSLNENWSIHSGLGIVFVQTRNSIGSFNDQQLTQDREGETFEFRYRFDNYIENQKHTVISIPLSVQYETNGEATRFYSKLGGSINLFVDSKSEARVSDLSTSGFFDRFNAELDAPRFAGFGDFGRVSLEEQDLDLKSSINALIELGVKQKLSEGHWIYVGVFADLGLNDILDSNGRGLISYNANSPTDFVATSSLNGRNQTTGQAFLDELNFNIVGVRLTYEFRGL